MDTGPAIANFLVLALLVVVVLIIQWFIIKTAVLAALDAHKAKVEAGPNPDAGRFV